MVELFREALAPCNWPLTLLVGLVGVYWLLVVVGALDFEIDVIDIDPGAESPVVGDISGGHAVSTGGAWLTLGNLLGFRRVPLVVWGSFGLLFLWAGSISLNHLFNEERGLAKAGLLLLPNLAVSLVLTKVVTIPIGRLFAAMAEAETEVEVVVGREAVVISEEVDACYGQVEIAARGMPVRVNARLAEAGEPVSKGMAVRVAAAGPDAAYYFVEPLSQHPSPSSQPVNPPKPLS